MSVTFFRLDRERIERALRAYAQALAGDPEVFFSARWPVVRPRL